MPTDRTENCVTSFIAVHFVDKTVIENHKVRLKMQAIDNTVKQTLSISL